MKCVDMKYSGVGPEDQSRFAYDFSEYEKIPTKTDYTLISVGPQPHVYDMFDKMVMMWFELPNCLILRGNDAMYNTILKREYKFLKFLVNCPYSAMYYNDLYKNDKFEYVFHPFNLKYLPNECEKIYDVYFTGNTMSPIDMALPVINKFKCCIVGYNWGTHMNQTYIRKLQLNAQSKISIVHGLLKWDDLKWNNASVPTQTLFSNHGAFELLSERGIVPQFKTRIMEAAACKSLMLCYKDPWNRIEDCFDENVDFIYWETPEDLEEKIVEILRNYDKYIPIVEHAYNTLVQKYSTERFFYKYLKDL